MEKYSDPVEEFNQYRTRMNARIFESESLVIKRFFNLDTNAYQEGAISKKNKELLGLCGSMVLRCDDCVKYHIGEALNAGAEVREIIETFEISLVVGGSIVIPHLRRAYEYLDACLKK